jgi:hypothetical protein
MLELPNLVNSANPLHMTRSLYLDLLTWLIRPAYLRPLIQKFNEG